MRSMWAIFALVQDGEIKTREQATALVDEEVAEIASFYSMTPEDARSRLLSNIGYVTGYFSNAEADRILDLFQTEHPVFGRTHPSPEEAYRLGVEFSKRKREND